MKVGQKVRPDTKCSRRLEDFLQLPSKASTNLGASQNAFVELFNGRFRDLCLNQHYFKTVADARAIIDRWREHYNRVKPHSSLGYRPPVLLEEQVA